MKIPKVQEEKQERIIYSIKCSLCERNIRGNSKEAAIYNYITHIKQKHKGEIEEKMGEENE